jgi:hypothetical protein
VVEGPVQLIDRVGPERVAHLGPVQRDPDRPLVHRTVVGDVGEAESLNFLPGILIEQLRNHQAAFP